MEEDIGVKAPVTRLRRRLSSVEQSDEVKSPSAPSTPNKKRGGRLAAKPQLELIDENSSENTPRKQTKKTTAKDVIEANDDKVLTPSRRSTRLKSNTSIVSDTPQNFDSPRAKRAARRNSQIGSDNEAPVTPARQTRRTRKDSTSSVDKQETGASVKNSKTIAEEAESDSLKSNSVKHNEITPQRQSPRLQKKNKTGDITNEELPPDSNNTPKNDNANKSKISDDSFTLINNLNEQPVSKIHFNNSASSVNSKNSKISRTNTWTAMENLSDNNSYINKHNKTEKGEKIKNVDNNVSNLETNNSKRGTDEVKERKDILNSSPRNKKNSISSETQISNSISVEKSNLELSISEKILEKSVNSKVLNETQKLLEKAPVSSVQALIYYDESDSDSRGKPTCDKPIENGDQCVPVIPQINNKSNLSQNDRVYNDICEPMDIDETMPTNVSILNSSDSNQEKESDKILEKSLLQKSNPEENISSTNKSKQELNSPLSTSQNNDKIGNENKSTLILSQLKDVSTNDNSLTKSPKSTGEFLSKSVNYIDNDTDKKHSLDYMTSTPLQQKNFKKMAIKINTSVINDSNNESAKATVEKHSKNDSRKFNESADESSSEESDFEHVTSKEKSDLLDNEAEEASDDYESGDSQDEEERQYEKENEIKGKGETLDSLDDASNDTDYEKDSFVVSSDEEDNDLLSGSGDDLSMSDNELTQSKKSKKKFDERKLKEQKKASREMFEARHNITNNSSKSELAKPKKKNNRQRLNSSALGSEEESIVKSKKNKRMKLDSSQDSSIENTDSNLAEKDDSVVEEHEITSVCNESVMNKNDPLSIIIKSEPQTPLKDINMSMAPILDEIEEVKMDQNVSILKSNETSDPLQEESDASSISENMEITSNYDSVLKQLNKEAENKKNKTQDISLNLNKKTKQNANAPIIDNLNLTQPKTSTQKSKNSNITETKQKADFDESSSDSIDLQLLFSEDSCDSINKGSMKIQKKETDNFIPLKRTEAKTNILDENNEETKQKTKDDSVLVTNPKNKKNSLSTSDNTDVKIDASVNEKLNNSQKESSLNMSVNTSLNTSKKKKKNSMSASEEKNISNVTNIEQDKTIPENQTVCDISMNNTLNTSTKKKKKKHSISVSEDIEHIDKVNTSLDQKNVSQKDISHEVSMDSTLNTSSKKKKKKHSTSVSEETINTHIDEQKELNKSLNKNDLNSSTNTSSKKNKQKKSISISEDTDINTSSNNSSKKEKKNSIRIDDVEISSDVMNVQENSFTSDEVLAKSSKNKDKSSVVEDLNLTATKINKVNDTLNSKKFKSTEVNIDEVNVNVSLNTYSHKKKKVKDADLQISNTVTQDDDSDAAPEEIPYKSHKNSMADLSGHLFIDTEGNQDWNTLITSSSTKKKNKKKKEVQDPATESNDIVSTEINSENTEVSKKRKRKLSHSTSEGAKTDPDLIDEPVNVENKSKKQKTNQEVPKTKGKRNKKRKERDDDDTNKSSKIFKQNSSSKINVPRLPPTILNQLEDKPRKDVLEMKKAKVVSTTQFIVEEAKKRKNKPSNYLEESVYLNDSVEEKKPKGFIKIPKVLPFVPTASVSGTGFTTKFQINVLQKETKFVAQTSNLTGFKNQYLATKKIKKVGTYELYKNQRNKKLSKF